MVSVVLLMNGLKSYLSNRKQYVSINGYDSNLANTNLFHFSKSVNRLNKYV